MGKGLNSSQGKGKRVLIVISSLRIGGGAEKIAATLGDELKKSGHKVFFLTFYDLKPIYPTLDDIHCLKERETGSKFLKLINRAREISKFSKKNKISTIFSFMEEANFPNVLSKLAFGNPAKIVVSVRINPIVNYNNNATYQRLIKSLYPRADSVVCLSKGVELILKKNYTLKNTTTIYNMHKTGDYLKKIKAARTQKNKKEFTFINIGRLSYQKGQLGLIRAFSEVAKKNESASLIIVGEGELKDVLISLAKRLGVASRVRIQQNQKNVFPLLKSSDCFVFSSTYEGFGNVLVEALAVNVPIISTDCESGPREILCPELNLEKEVKYPYLGKWGILTKNMSLKSSQDDGRTQLDNEEKMLAKIMDKILNDKKLQKRYSHGESRIKDFDSKRIVGLWEKEIS